MMPSAAWMISSPFAAACGFSIFAISGTSTPRIAEVLAHRVQILAPAYEREGEEIDPHLEAGVDQLDVLLAHRGQRHGHVRKVDPLPRGHAAADLDLGHDLAVATSHPQPDRAVGQVEHVALVHELREALPRHRQPLDGALYLLGRQDHLRVARELRHAARHRADAELRAGQVPEDRHIPAGPLGRRPDRLGDLAVLVRGAVGEVQPGDVHARRIICSSTSGSFDDGPMVATIFVERIASNIPITALSRKARS